MLRNRLRALEAKSSAGRPQIDDICGLTRWVTLRDAGQWTGPEPSLTPRIERVLALLDELKREEEAAYDD